MQLFDIYFRGNTLPDEDPATVRQRVGELFKVDGEALDRLFTGKPVRVKKSVDVDTASRYRGRFREAGALIDIVPSGEMPSEIPSAATETGSEAASTSERVTDSGVAETPLADLAEPGAILDETPAPPPADIDTSGLEALPPNTGSLEDCQQDKPPRPIPDISHLRLVDD